MCNEYREGARFNGQSGLLTFFSGDAFNPSLESSVTKGKIIAGHITCIECGPNFVPGSHMVPVLNTIGTDVACVGVNYVECVS